MNAPVRLRPVYLDANATQPLRFQARDALLAALQITGNPSSVHAAGRAARRIMEDARETIAASFDVRARDVIFTSGGTEADALAVHALGCGRRIIVSAIEHDAIRASAARHAGADQIRRLPVGASGQVDTNTLAEWLADGVPTLVCVMLANNETGVIQPVTQIAQICRPHRALLHVDAIQAAGRMPVSLHALGAHSLAISSHKLGGPTGAGALLLAEDAPFDAPLIAGGGQERGRRGGSPPVAMLAAFAAAAQAALAEDQDRIAALRDQAEAAALDAGAVVCGDPATRLPNTTCLALPGAAAGTQVMALDLDGVAVSAGAACSSGKVQASHVLLAMGLGALAGQAIRVSLPWNVVEEDIDAFIAAYRRMADRLRAGLVTEATAT